MISGRLDEKWAGGFLRAIWLEKKSNWGKNSKFLLHRKNQNLAGKGVNKKMRFVSWQKHTECLSTLRISKTVRAAGRAEELDTGPRQPNGGKVAKKKKWKKKKIAQSNEIHIRIRPQASISGRYRLGPLYFRDIYPSLSRWSKKQWDPDWNGEEVENEAGEIFEYSINVISTHTYTHKYISEGAVRPIRGGREWELFPIVVLASRWISFRRYDKKR